MREVMVNFIIIVKDGRINGNLNLSRAIGDLDYKKDLMLPPEKQIISVEPDIIVRVYYLLKNLTEED